MRESIFRSLLVIVMILIAVHHSFAQAVVYDDFKIIPAMPNTGFEFARGYYQSFSLFSYSGDFEGSKVLFDNKHIMVMGQSRQKQARVMMLTEKGDSLWTLNFPGVCHRLGRLGKNALLIHGEKAGIKNFKEWEIFASLIDPATGKVLKTTTIFRQSTDYLSEPKFFIDPAGRYFYTAARKTGTAPRKFYYTIWVDSYSKTKEFTITKYSADLQPEPALTLPLSHEDDSFVSAGMAENGDLMMLFFSKNGTVTSERRNNRDDFKRIDTLSFNISLSKEPKLQPFFQISPETGKSYLHLVYYNASWDNMVDFVTFDYEKRKITRTTEITDKKTDETIKASYQEVGGVDLGKPRLHNTLIPASAILRKDSLIVILREEVVLKEILPTARNFREEYFVAGNLIIDVFNGSNERIKRWLIPKTYLPESMVGIQSNGFISDNKLTVFCNDSRGNGRPVGIVSVFDLTSLTPVSRHLIEKGTAKKWMSMEPSLVMRFDKTFLIPYAESDVGMGGINAHFDTVLEQYTPD